MQMILFAGLQAAGKSTLFMARFANTHIRINLDMLRTRNREKLLINACIDAKQPFVVENTNLTIADRAVYITLAKAARFQVLGYRFQVPIEVAMARNAQRPRPVPEKAIRAAFKNWQLPDWAEGFDALFDVSGEQGEFTIREVEHEQQ